MADLTSAEIQAIKKMSYDEKIEYFNKTGINVFALDLETIVASDIAEAIKDDTTDGATIEEKIENNRTSMHPIAINSAKNNKKIIKKVEEFVEEEPTETVIGHKDDTEVDSVSAAKYTARYAQDEAKFVHTNVLHQYASYNYIFTLSGLREADVRYPATIIGAPAHDIIARSGGIGAGGGFSSEKLAGARSGDYEGVDPGFQEALKTAGRKEEERLQGKYGSSMKFSGDILRENHDIYFERVNIEGVHAPNEDRKLMNFTKIEFELSEPFGVTLYEKLRGAANNCGYLDHMDAPFLLTLEFVGYDSKGNPIRSIEGVSKKYYPIKLVNSTVDINQAGSRYTLTALPYTEFAMVNRFNYVRGPIEVTGGSIAEQFESIVNGIDNIQETEIENKQRELKDEYRITFDPYFDGQKVESAGDPMTFWNIGKFDVPPIGTRPGAPDYIDSGFQKELREAFPLLKALQMRDGTAIPSTLEAIMMRTSAYNDIATNFVEKYWKKTMQSTSGAAGAPIEKRIQQEYVPWFKIITSVYTHSALDAITKMHRKTIHYHIQPYLIHIGNFVAPGLTGAGKWGKLVKKKYNYIYTGENLDILDLNINYKYAFFQARMADASTLDHDSKQLNDFNEKKTENMFIGRNGLYGDELFGVRSSPVSSGSQNDGEFASDKKSAKTREFYDYLTNPLADMIKVEMNIMGDPAWIGNDQYIPMSYMPNYDPKNPVMVAKKMGTVKGHTWSEETGSFNLDEAEPLVTLDFKFPTDFDEKAGTYNFNKSGKNVRFSGLYKVVKVTSNFENGQFTQDLMMIRIKNQGGTNKTATPSIETAKISKDDSEKKTDGTFSYSENAQEIRFYPTGETFVAATEHHNPGSDTVSVTEYDMMNLNNVKHEILPGVKHDFQGGRIKKWDPLAKQRKEQYENKRILIDPKTGKPYGNVLGGL
tara:strand:+ start:8582 stop:11374 length:2793 start_codon:yes stop_codon:yes gene_type:complete